MVNPHVLLLPGGLLASMAPDRQAQQIVGYVFLGLMALFVILGVTTFEGTPTIMLIIGALVFLAVSLTLLTGNGIGLGTGGGGSQQQSIVLSGGRVITQSGGQVQAACGSCKARMPDGARFCPDCGSGA